MGIINGKINVSQAARIRELELELGRLQTALAKAEFDRDHCSRGIHGRSYCQLCCMGVSSHEDTGR